MKTPFVEVFHLKITVVINLSQKTKFKINKCLIQNIFCP